MNVEWNCGCSFVDVLLGVALKQLTSFFTQLKENDDEDVGSTASDEAEQ